MHNLFLVYLVNLYMFRAYLGPSSGGTTVCIQQLVLIILLDNCLSSWFLHECLLSWLDWFQSNQGNSYLKRIISTNWCIHTVVPHGDGSRYARNMYRLMKYTKNKLCIKLVLLCTRKEHLCKEDFMLFIFNNTQDCFLSVHINRRVRNN